MHRFAARNYYLKNNSDNNNNNRKVNWQSDRWRTKHQLLVSIPHNAFTVHPRSHPSAHERLGGLNFQLPFLIDTARRYSIRNSPLLFPRSLCCAAACTRVHAGRGIIPLGATLGREDSAIDDGVQRLEVSGLFFPSLFSLLPEGNKGRHSKKRNE